MNRARVVAQSVVLVMVFGVSCVGATAAAPKPVSTDKGAVQGVPTADGGVVAYKGIPFAAPPVGDLRWRPPQPAKPWKGVFEAQTFGSHCMQSESYGDMVFHDPGPSEDCLTLNVWTPAAAKPVKAGQRGGLPVMVWIFGGGFVSGSTSENRQDGQFLAKRDVVVVSMNYRLGIFGFMALPGLAEESPQHAAGNYGLMDQAAAIAWVRRNIAGFGGDSANITIFGESAGSSSVSAQMASPMTKDLIAKAIGESGAAFKGQGLGTAPLAKAEASNAAWAMRRFGSSAPAALRAISADDLQKAVTARPTPGGTAGPPPHFGMDVDGYFLTDTLPNLFAAGKQAHIPVLGGWNANEQRAPGDTTAASWAAVAQKQFGEKAGEFLAVYPGATDAEALRSADDFASDRFIAFSTWEWLEAAARTGGAPVYRYYFDLPSPGDRNHSIAAGTFHSDDIEYVFGALDSRPEMKIRPEDRQTSELMMRYWTDFAKTGDPNGPGLPTWPRYDAQDHWEVMHLDASPVAKPATDRARYMFLQGAWAVPAAQR